ncbi:MAG: hypothetical protein U9Q15_04605 [Patescibacteria group bacterium]|nr:hypothetical protein [Patescibacteria group bacterium]
MNKKKLLIIGSGPMLIEKGIVGTALGLRSWHILKPLMDSGDFEIDMFNIIFPEKYPEDHPIHKQHTSPAEIQNSFLDILPDLGPGLSITNINKDLGNTKKTLQRKLDSKNYNAIISINTHPSFIASKLKRTCPLWSDLNGWVMGEAQAQAGAWNDDSMLPKLWQMEQAIIQSADHFSTVSLPQKYALIGELASIGRLNSKTNNYEFAHVIENATDIQTFDTLQTKEADTSISENIQKIIES